MFEILLKIIIAIYAAEVIITTLGYLPTVKDLWHHKLKSANIASYATWSVGTGGAVLYSIFVLPDLLFQIVSGVNFFFCILILGLSLKLKYAK
jgi:hypothetical protein